MPKVEAAILIVLKSDGTYSALNSIPVDLEINRQATRQEIKTGCFEIVEAIQRDAIAEAVTAKLSKLAQSDSEKASSSIRQALESKGIL
jgi:phosphoribosylaminoimidazole carboxylase (NCAIR synthetase)